MITKCRTAVYFWKKQYLEYMFQYNNSIGYSLYNSYFLHTDVKKTKKQNNTTLHDKLV